MSTYGDEITSTTNDREKFGTYTRDSYTGLDYADQRWFTSTYGRFNTADPYQASAGAGDPASWNRYSYVEGDPANGNDPAGLALQAPGECDDSNLWDGCSNRSNSLAYYYCGTASSAVLALSPELSPICSQIMQAALPVVQPAAPAQSDAPTCSVSLYERPVALGQDHAFLDASTSYSNGASVEEIVDGGPTLGPSPTGLLLTGWNTPGSVGHYATDNPALPTSVQVGNPVSGANVCGDITKINSEVSTYNAGAKVAYNPVPNLYLGGWNSNSFAYTLLNSVGLAFSFGNLPVSAPGWGYQVPGLTHP